MQNDSEKEKMRSALGSAIMMEKPNVKVRQPNLCQLQPSIIASHLLETQ